MTAVKIIVSALISGIFYGIVHNMFTAHLCVEYFTIGHPKVIESDSPIDLALIWGIIATWWLALPMGLLMAGFNHIGTRPSLAYKEVMALMLKQLLFMAGGAVLAAVIGYVLAEYKIIYLVPQLASTIYEAKHSAFLAAAWAHSVSYLIGLIGCIIVCRVIAKQRKNREVSLANDRNKLKQS